MKNKISRNTIFIFLFGLLNSFANGQTGSQRIDSIMGQMAEIENDSIRIRNLSDVAYSFESTEPNIAMKLYDIAIDQSQKKQFGLLEGLNYRYKGLVYKDQSNYDSALLYFKLADEKMDHGPIINEKAKLYFDIATVYQLKGDFESAASYYIQSIRLFEETAGRLGISRASSNLGALYLEMGLVTNAIYYDSTAVAMAKQIQDSSGLASSLVNLGIAKGAAGQNTQVLPQFMEAMTIAESLNDQFILSYVYSNLADYYGKQKNFSKALDFSSLALEIARTQNNLAEMSTFRHFKGYYQMKTGDIYEGIGNMEAALKSNRELGLEEERIDLLIHLAEAYEAVGNIKKALDLTRSAHFLNDSIYNHKMQQTVNELRLKYETENKERRIMRLEFNQQLQERRNRNLVYFLAGLGLLLILLGFLVVFYRQKLRISRLLAKQNEEINQRKIQALEQEKTIHSMDAMIRGQEEERARIANDLHDGLGSLLSTIQMHFNKIQEELNSLQKLNAHLKAFEMLDDACVEVRKISHDMMPGALEKLGLMPALNDLVNNLKSTGKMNVVMQEFGDKQKLDKTQEMMLYRIVQELMNNVSKHAQANELIVQFTWHENMLNLIVEDDGKGFDQDKIEAGLGLESIQRRVDYLRGKLYVESAVGKGSTFTMDIPINN
ncbi:MAG TPA: sensor histidine kinase [Bacteroidales bacterium]|nr:sensor histidine kinase [Bacteroidales bacterium]HRX97488.1 sensor histidine kinase [Bacteroidales bacterium]